MLKPCLIFDNRHKHVEQAVDCAAVCACVCVQTVVGNMRVLVCDEADNLLDMGFR